MEPYANGRAIPHTPDNNKELHHLNLKEELREEMDEQEPITPSQELNILMFGRRGRKRS
jgi:hypothetical protein